MSAMVDIAKNHEATTANATPLADLHPGRGMPSLDSAPHQSADLDRTSPAGQHRNPVAVLAPTTLAATAARYLLACIRIALGWIFLWAFLDKTFGLGFSTPTARSWLNAGSPTQGFLSSSKGPFSGFFTSIAGTAAADFLFMAALLAIGTALILGIAMRPAAAGGAVLTIMMWAAVLPPTTNPFMDDHVIYAAVLIVLTLMGAGNTLGLGRPWSASPLVRRAPWLQ